MISAFQANSFCARQVGRHWTGALLIVTLSIMLAGCGDKKKDAVATQAAARVNSQEITVHQINFALEQQRGLTPAQAASASRLMLTRLVDQELALQEAQNQKLDRDPRVVRQIEAARREIIARAYADRIGATAAAPSAEDIKQYYTAHPALFQERRVYTLEELSIQAGPEQTEALQQSLRAAKDSAAFVDYLKSQGFKFGVRQALTPAEQLPLDRLGAFAMMKDGQSVFTPVSGGAQVLTMVSSKLQPVSEEQARPAIEQFILNDRRHKAIRDDLAALRTAAKIEYLGEFAGDPKLQEVAPSISAAASNSPAASASSDAPFQALPDASPSSSSVENALKGFK